MSEIQLRSAQHSDLAVIETILSEAFAAEYGDRSIDFGAQLRRIRRWYGMLKLLSLFPNRFQHLFNAQVAERDGEVLGVIQTSPFNSARTTWRVDHIAVSPTAQRQGVASQLLRHCMEAIQEARTWILEVNINNKGAMALYRQQGFQPLAQITYWSVPPTCLTTLQDPDLPNLMPVSNSDAYLIYQLDTAAMPPQVRQVYDRHVDDFKRSLFDTVLDNLKQTVSNTERVQAFVLEPERNAAIGYFNIKLSRTGNQPHVAQLTVHPAYTWLYPELLAQMAKLTRTCPPQSLYVASTDYQPEREEFLQKLGATAMERTLLMSRSVWHKVQEVRTGMDTLSIESMLRSLNVNQPVPEQPTTPFSSDQQDPPDTAAQ